MRAPQRDTDVRAATDLSCPLAWVVRLRMVLLRWLLLLCLAPEALCAAPALAVIYPDLGEPYRSIFISIISGIEAELGETPLLIPVDRDTSASALAKRIEASQVTAVIALGRSSVGLVEAANLDVPVVRGAIVEYKGQSGNGHSGISLTPDPKRLFEYLQRIAPKAKTVTVVYSQEQIDVLIERAAQAAGSLGLTFNAQRVDDLMGAASAYRALVEKLGAEDALWIIQDAKAVDEKVILPMLLNAAWEKGFLLFSSYAEHAKRGALFSVYPDNFGMGKRLAQLAQAASEPNKPDDYQRDSIQPLEDLFIAVNLRAAEHVGLAISPDLMRTFDLTFPQR